MVYRNILFYIIIIIVVVIILIGLLKFKTLGTRQNTSTLLTSPTPLFKTSSKQERVHITSSLIPSTNTLPLFSSTTTSSPYIGRANSIELVKIVVVVDNNPGDLGLETAWGLSVLVEILKPYHRVILFDTGPSPSTLAHNLEVLKIDPKKIDYVVISHEHGDHVNGLEYLAKVNPGLTVYVPSHMGKYTIEWIKDLGFKVVKVNNTVWIDKGVAIIGELYGPPYEQALAINLRDHGLLIFVGCSHPGVVNIVRKAVQDLGIRPYLVLGGFHMAGSPYNECMNEVKELINLGLLKIAPIHCSGDTIRGILCQYFYEHYLESHVGSTIVLP